MRPFRYEKAADAAAAVQFFAQGAQAKYLGGGTNLVDLMRENIEHPETVIDVTGFSREIRDTEDGGLLIGAGTKNTAAASHRAVRERYPVLAQAILAGASAQIRNMATVGGNLMQRTRCYYFYDHAGSRCNKREPGSGCDAAGGFNRYHAIIGASPACSATHPSDMCVALAALDARIHVSSTGGARTIPVVEFHRLPGDRPDLETMLEAGEVIVAVEIPPSPFARYSTYRKVRDRASYAFALVSVAAGLTMRGDRIDDIRIAFGGIAPKPWRAFRAEEALRGGPGTPEAFEAAAAVELADAVPLAGNAFKIELAKRTLTAVLTELTGGAR